MNNWKLYINGTKENAKSGQTYGIVNPATEQQVAFAAYGDGRDARLAIEAAAGAFASWSRLPAKERAEILHSLADGVEEHRHELASLITLEMGKPLKEAAGEVRIAADYLRWNAEEAIRTYGQIIPASTAGKRLLSIRQPIGPVGAITPWNFPLSMAARKIGPALAAGCTLVLKPSELTPGAALRLAEIATAAGVPAGVLNVVTGDPSAIGDELLSHPAIKKITFTGSTEVGKHLLHAAADQVKKVSLELGGHAPFIVFDDADLDAAVSGAINSKFRNAGQTCICANRIYVQEAVAERFLEKFKAAAEALVVGDGFLEETTMGPLINAKALEKVQHHVQDALNKGAVLLTGGRRKPGLPGYYYEPTILINVNEQMVVACEETFGPVAPIRTFATEEEAIRLANDSNYGLAAYYYTKDLDRMIRVYEALEYGIIGCNDAVPTAVEGPFGGMKESGIGREGGPESLADFLETKFVSIGLSDRA
ncbi:NAD-dependent succinate-semialdehyde dehydrogenase [Paenibacillus senegalensis]|uniref:NAD-dependent succinate-semialdehyde dehydrogenase n=1 Tax=Paenibacillus senegalensis TaxID=1465766 RepID=UPI000289224F|nr:NAD-dependent succinate-semialdehyde dehydrogenase [Paenibacillus senegalensis]